MSIQHYTEKGLIRKENIKPEEIAGSIDLAKRFLERAKGNMNIKFWDIAFLLAYNSMFHTARALLFRAGYKERSHMAIIDVLKELYKNNPELEKFLDILDSYRISRHAIQYRGSLCSELDAEEAVRDAGKFVAIVAEIIKKKT